jgi:transcriptional regulator of aromatic amino acid metabolism
MTELVEVAEVTGEEPRVVEDETLAVRCAATTFLITAAIAADVQAVGRRIHAASVRAGFPFVHVSAAALPTDATVFAAACTRLLDAARGGSLLLTNVQEMSAFGQESLIETLAELQGARDPLAAVRLIAGTTVILHDCIAAGTFSERLFYRLNIIHVVVPGCFATRHTMDARTPTRAELQAPFVNDDHISEVLAESSPTWSEPADSRAVP